MKFEIHPDAERHFDELAEDLSHSFGILSPDRTRKPTFRPPIQPAANLTKDDIVGDIQVRGDAQRYVISEQGTFGLHGEACEEFRRLARRIQELQPLRDYVSVDFVQAQLFDWLQQRYHSRTNLAFLSFLTSQCERQVREVEFWFPLASVHIETEFRIGRTALRTLTPAIFDEYENLLLSNRPDAGDAVRQRVLKDRKSFQGFAAAAVLACAEPIRAFEVARQEAQIAVAMLRFFHPANFSPSAKSFCTLAGQENYRKSTDFVFVNGGIRTINRRVLERSHPGWFLDNQWIAWLRREGLDQLSQLLIEGNRSPFEEDLLAAIRVYSKNSLSDATEDKLVYIFSALESILLRNRSEPITKNIGERMSFLIGDSIEKRRAIVKNVEETYEKRSLFVHHGRKADDEPGLAEFMLNAWTCLLTIVHQASKFRTKVDLIEALENRKLS